MSEVIPVNSVVLSELAFYAWLNGKSLIEIRKLFGVDQGTLRSWMRAGRWEERKSEIMRPVTEKLQDLLEEVQYEKLTASSQLVSIVKGIATEIGLNDADTDLIRAKTVNLLADSATKLSKIELNEENKTNAIEVPYEVVEEVLKENLDEEE